MGKDTHNLGKSMSLQYIDKFESFHLKSERTVDHEQN
jgi:hypothetical protein